MLDCSSAALTETEAVPELIRRWMPTGVVAHIHFNDPNRRGPGDGVLAFGPVLKAAARRRLSGQRLDRAVRL